MLFSGSHHLSLDEKGRLAVPARFRQHLSDRCGGQLIVTRGPDPACLVVYPMPEFERLADDIEKMEDRDAAERAKAITIGFAADAEMDKQGRILVPPNLRKIARLEGPAVLMGQIRRFDLWAAAEWEARFGEGSPLFADSADAFRTLKR
ncbi:MAG: division/cell wall cluster transcriptional repressor MraZ [Solimonas sp.]